MYIQCLIVDDDKLARQVLQKYVNETDYLELAGMCSSSVEAGNILQKTSVDLLFLDIEMPELSGLEFIKTLHRKPAIILTTSYKKYALEAFELDVSDYLVKPIPRGRFMQAVQRVKENMTTHKPAAGNNAGDIFVKVDTQLVKLHLNDITFIEALGDYVGIQIGNKQHTVHTTMKEIMRKLPSNRFVRIHRSFIVNVSMIDTMEDNILSVKGKLLPVGKSYKEKLLRHLKPL